MATADSVLVKARELGADLVGIAPVARFAGAPLRMSPQGLLPGARAVVVAAIHHTDASVELGGEPAAQPEGPYHVQWLVMNPKLDDVAFLLARFLESRGHRALPIVSSNIWRYGGYKEFKLAFAPDLAHRYAAVAAGLGEIGWSGLFLTPQFGPRQRVVSVITDADLEPTPMYGGPPLCDRCMECVKNCPTDAFRKEVRGMNQIEVGGRTFRFPETNKWRCAWAENFGLDLAHKIPEKVDEQVILTYLEKYGHHAGEEGSCLKFCMVPERRYYDPSYCRAPRRRRGKRRLSAQACVSAIKAICRRCGVEAMAIGRAADLAKVHGIRPQLHLPDAVSVISVAVRPPGGNAPNPDVTAAARRRLDYAAWEMAHFLDVSGLSAISHTRIADGRVAGALGVHAPAQLHATVLTSARLPAATLHARRLKALDAEQLRACCRRHGADLVGFFSVARFERFRRALQAGLAGDTAREVVRDTNRQPGLSCPEVSVEDAALKGPQDWLPGARSVIVLGLRFPDASLDMAKVTPAATVGPFAFVQFETLNLLGDAAFMISRRLEAAGHRATFTTDLTGQASKVQSSRGLLPDMRANGYAALLAGLAYIGVHGHPITPRYGVRQRFMAIVTDCPLPDDPLLDLTPACGGCDAACVGACPTAAITRKGRTVTVEGRTFRLGAVDGFACDWAKRYCLSGKEGPAYMGVEVEAPLPKERTADAVAAAVSKVDWGVQKRHLNVAEECLRVCPAHRIHAEREKEDGQGATGGVRAHGRGRRDGRRRRRAVR